MSFSNRNNSGKYNKGYGRSRSSNNSNSNGNYKPRGGTNSGGGSYEKCKSLGVEALSRGDDMLSQDHFQKAEYYYRKTNSSSIAKEIDNKSEKKESHTNSGKRYNRNKTANNSSNYKLGNKKENVKTPSEDNYEDFI